MCFVLTDRTDSAKFRMGCVADAGVTLFRRESTVENNTKIIDKGRQIDGCIVYGHRFRG